MKQIITNSTMALVVVISGFLFLATSCSKAKKCEDNNTFTLIVKNTLPNGTIQFNLDHDFVSVNGSSDYSVKAGETLNVDIPAGGHTIYARSVITNCVGGRCSVTVTGKPDKSVNQQACSQSTIVY